MINALVFDGDYLFHRTMYQKGVQNMYASDGEYSGGVYGVFSRIRNTLHKFPVFEVYWVWDGGHSKRRKRLYKDYKSGRLSKRKAEDLTEDELQLKARMRSQRHLLYELIPLLGVRVVQLKGREGDDVVALLARTLASQGKHVGICSEDSDFFQMVSELISVVKLYSDVLVTPQVLQESGVPQPWQVIYKSIIGDTSDDIPGVSGTGKKTVKELIAEYKKMPGSPQWDFHDFIRFCSEHKSKRVQHISEQRTRLKINMDLIDLRYEQFTEDELAYVGNIMNQSAHFSYNAVLSFCYNLGFDKVIRAMSSYLNIFQGLR